MTIVLVDDAAMGQVLHQTDNVIRSFEARRTQRLKSQVWLQMTQLVI